MFQVTCPHENSDSRFNGASWLKHSQSSTLHHVLSRFRLTVKLQVYISILESWSIRRQTPLPPRYQLFVISSTSVRHLKGLLSHLAFENRSFTTWTPSFEWSCSSSTFVAPLPETTNSRPKYVSNIHRHSWLDLRCRHTVELASILFSFLGSRYLVLNV